MFIPKQIRQNYFKQMNPSTGIIKCIIQKPDADADMSDTLQNDG